MYDIDINFLKDRKLDALSSPTAYRKKSVSNEEKLPLFIGGGIAVALIGIAGGALLLLNAQKSSQNKQIAQLDSEIQRLQGKTAEVQQIQAEIDNANREVAILVSVFEQLKPWSAMLSEIASVTPSDMQISAISQVDSKTLSINGYADSYDRVNDLLLTLKNSPLLDAEFTKLDTTSLVDNPNQIIFNLSQLNTNNDQQNGQPTGVQVELPKVVSYTITTAITEESSIQYLNQLNRQGATGLVSRITTLRRKGALDLQVPDIYVTEPISEGETQP